MSPRGCRARTVKVTPKRRADSNTCYLQTGRSPNTHTHPHTKKGTERDGHEHARFPIPKSSMDKLFLPGGWGWSPGEPVLWHENSRFIVFAGFRAVNVLTRADFGLPVWCLEEGRRASTSQLRNTLLLPRREPRGREVRPGTFLWGCFHHTRNGKETLHPQIRSFHL